MNKLVTVESAGPIRLLGNINGPIKTPCSLSTDVIIDLINNNKIVYEVNPKNYNEKVRLTRLNINSDIFPSVVKSKIATNKKVIKNNIKKRIEKTKTVENKKNADVSMTIQKSVETSKFSAANYTLMTDDKSQTSNTITTTTSSIPTSSFVSNKNSRKKRRR